MLLSESSWKFRHAVAYSYSVGRHCWTNWWQGGCRWCGRCRVQRTREWQIEGYIMLVATNNPQELKSELWYSRINGSLIMHLIKDKKTTFLHTIKEWNTKWKTTNFLMTSSIKQEYEYKSMQSLKFFKVAFPMCINLWVNRLSYLFKVVPDQLKNKASVNQRQKIIREKGKTGI